MKTLKLAFAVVAMVASVSTFAQEEKKQKPSPEKAFKRFDANEDGKITKDELEGKKILNRFDKLDKDSDGSISLEEFTAAMSKGKGKGKGDKPKKVKEQHSDDMDDNDGGEE
ncbi:hypothetical protein AXE80_06635 [Wenyingzhuangia fucanilytica]|uniref:EF-hand domain-containing protein n=1 Tax=Wenyingzhuangia fucanilytica TaxID=1790137 RepID=A0A1B1Y5E0_9FLAO|nr:EF-hand domain-containing protein [Wenyingzhuangia fucanilytica]ANW95974.1 hypothetical protein AXE80_06635 [Wenyingzhuangia fucanilytica]